MSVKEERERMGYSQEKMSRELDMQLRTYQRIEKENTCSLKNALNIATILGKTVEELFGQKKR